VSYIRHNADAKGVCVKVHINQEVLEQLKAKETIVFDVEQKFGVKLSFIADTTFHLERYRIPHSA
jgi:invasion protein IalB